MTKLPYTYIDTYGDYPVVSDDADQVDTGDSEVVRLTQENDELRAHLTAVPDKARCGSCEHYMEFHQADGCWHAVIVGRQDKPVGCPCGVPVIREADDA